MQAGENDARGGARTRDALCALHLKCSPFDQLGHPCFLWLRGRGGVVFWGARARGGACGLLLEYASNVHYFASRAGLPLDIEQGVGVGGRGKDGCNAGAVFFFGDDDARAVHGKAVADSAEVGGSSSCAAHDGGFEGSSWKEGMVEDAADRAVFDLALFRPVFDWDWVVLRGVGDADYARGWKHFIESPAEERRLKQRRGRAGGLAVGPGPRRGWEWTGQAGFGSGLGLGFGWRRG